MEKEYYFSGYCRTTDQSRMVCCEVENGKLCEVDCNFETCPYTDCCTIAQEISSLTEP